MTLDGTRTYLIGVQNLAVIDPGPRLQQHSDAIVAAAGSAAAVSIVLTHSHPDHAEAAHDLADRLQAPILSAQARTLHDNQVVATDAGALVALATPGHTPDHFCFWWETERAVFCGDLMMGGLDTALVARPEGDLVDYISSLHRIRALDSRVIYPAHGPRFDQPAAAIDQYIAHREQRVAQVVEGLRDGPLSADELLDEVYGSQLDPGLRPYAESAIEAYLAYLHTQQRVRQAASGVWSLV